uniref:EGF-like domain-containing protein n=1 Tax=Chromera velia CCMP2878 TaxID=1169474 RepID=A0A0G4FKI5_9ALVE|mmetsp:Transcript_50270/g.98989  ORF Transcript_50270/g.98989 Transcript_50270/m.98989 type:complete len:362 (-) Transcript_50270:959-2044(-)|eukprot:Cvel_3455.t1-p1 / transcript=Cvel_3455.t1 / gene=Cvel_3455 / organism=Chromera_velia_CCMP2878 / gene_product=hypothetical protein / transcript_product=hypothetical protein / location=Cvel_scaffold139:64428-67508(-) / protein_length=361 / sequence_SO=supercontig / SO=protein_coding / is_pseudo=false
MGAPRTLLVSGLLMTAATVISGQPSISISKFTNGASELAEIAAGETVVWTYEVLNNGDIPFDEAELVVTDDQEGLITNIVDKGNDDTTLSPFEVWIYEQTGIAQDLSGGTYVNIGEVAADDVTDFDQSSYRNPAPNPAIDIEKFTNGLDNDNLENGLELEAGFSLVWSYEVTNTGDVPFDVSDIVVTDDQEGIITNISDQGNGDNTLDPGETWIYEKDGIAVSSGCYFNIATVMVSGTEVSDEDSSGYINPGFQAVDECATQADNCDEDATCTDTPCSFECTCNDGFMGDGVTCEDKEDKKQKKPTEKRDGSGPFKFDFAALKDAFELKSDGPLSLPSFDGKTPLPLDFEKFGDMLKGFAG